MGRISVVYQTDTDPRSLETQLRASIYQTERMGFSATAAAMRDILAELVLPKADLAEANLGHRHSYRSKHA